MAPGVCAARVPGATAGAAFGESAAAGVCWFFGWRAVSAVYLIWRFLRAALGSVVLGIALLGLGAYVYFLRSAPPLQPWHTVQLESEFSADKAPYVRSVAEYLELEQELFGELEERLYRQCPDDGRSTFVRYCTGSRSDPQVWPVNWNRSYERVPANPRAAALLLHGLTDSPYSMRSIAESLAASGVRVLALRLPGHGTAPSGLLSFRLEDMQAAVRLAMRDLRRRAGPDLPLYIVGYSNGGGLAVDYALDVLAGEDLPAVNGLVLVSPEIGLTPLAALGRISLGLSDLPGLGKVAWQEVTNEFDPYKYSSFSFNAAGQAQRLTSSIATRIQRLGARMTRFPPVLAFVSTVDSTVKADAVADTLFARLSAPGNELVLFDVNRLALARALLIDDPGPLTRRLLQAPDRPYTLSVVSNLSPDSTQVAVRRAVAGSGETVEEALDLSWPQGVFSLSHVALPFPPDDPLYGYAAQRGGNHVQLGWVEARGENGVLSIPNWLMLRQRSNPFFSWMMGRIEGFIAPAGEAAGN